MILRHCPISNGAPMAQTICAVIDPRLFHVHGANAAPLAKEQRRGNGATAHRTAAGFPLRRTTEAPGVAVNLCQSAQRGLNASGRVGPTYFRAFGDGSNRLETDCPPTENLTESPHIPRNILGKSNTTGVGGNNGATDEPSRFRIAIEPQA
jgi:hypothetical protein